MTQRVPQPGDFAQIGCMWCRNPLRNPLHRPFGPLWALRTRSSHSSILHRGVQAGEVRTPTRRSRDASLHATGYMSATSADMQASSILLPLHNRHLRDPGDPEGAPAVPCGGPHPPELSIFAPKWRFWAIFGQKCPFLGEVKNGAKICANFKIFGPRGAQDFGPQNP